MKINEYTTANLTAFENDFMNTNKIRETIGFFYKVPVVNTITFVDKYLNDNCNMIVDALKQYDPKIR